MTHEDHTWIKLYRKSIRSRVFHNEGLWKVWTWCLMKANHEQKWVPFKTGTGTIEIKVCEGQFIFGRKSASEELRMPESSVWKRITKLKNIKNLNIESNSQYSIITIINWDSYQCKHVKDDSESDRQGTAREQAGNTDKNDKNVKNLENLERAAHHLPENFQISTEMHSWFADQRFEHNTDIEVATSEWADYWRSKGKKMKDWAATWRNGMRKKEEWLRKDALKQSRTHNRRPMTAAEINRQDRADKLAFLKRIKEREDEINQGTTQGSDNGRIGPNRRIGTGQ